MSNRGFFLQSNDHNLVWHPFDKPGTTNIVIKKAQGVYYTDTNNKRYIDAISSWWVNIHGHGHIRLRNAITRQFRKTDQIIFSGFTHEPAVRFSDAILKKTGSIFNKVFYSDNGSTSVEVAIKLGLQFLYKNNHKKVAILAFNDAYHGDTFGAMSVGGRNIFNADFNDLLFDVFSIPVPTSENIKDLLTQIQKLQEHHDALLFIYEPLIQGSGGMNIYDPKELQKILRLIKQKPNICIADEVMTGFYRTGTFTASEQISESDNSLNPDLMCLSKGITGGVMPLSVTLVNEPIVRQFSETKFYHGHSYTGNPLACSLALESLKLFDEKKLENIRVIGQQHVQFCQKIGQNPAVQNMQCLGTILRMEIKTDEQTGYTNSIRDTIYDFFIDHGVLIRPLGNVIYVMPPYCITRSELKKIYSAIEKFLQQLPQMH